VKKLHFDFPSLQISTVEAGQFETGVTLVKFARPVTAVCDIRGGAAAVRESSSIDELSTDGVADAIVLAGGSSFGLEAASGVMSKILAERQGSTNFVDIPCVPSAIVYDFRNRTNKTLYPTRELGELAYDKLEKGHVKIGRVGAGANVFVGKYLSHLSPEQAGQGASFLEVNGIKILAITVVNALGNIVDFDGNIRLGSLDPKNHTRKDMCTELLAAKSAPMARGNTTISLIVTNARLTRPELKRLAVMAHSNMARVIDPFHTPWDGDTLFACTTDEVDLNDQFSMFDLGIVAAKTMQKSCSQPD
jgi:L-aminopeptidase/D-esterase-like protein